MAMNRIQFQSGLSMLEFLKSFGTEAQCEQALEVARSGCYHTFNFRKYAARYLAAFGYRFNRCFDLCLLHERLLIAVVSATPQPLHSIRMADVHCQSGKK